MESDRDWRFNRCENSPTQWGPPLPDLLHPPSERKTLLRLPYLTVSIKSKRNYGRSAVDRSGDRSMRRSTSIPPVDRCRPDSVAYRSLLINSDEFDGRNDAFDENIVAETYRPAEPLQYYRHTSVCRRARTRALDFIFRM